jgi:hypothetical protein
MARRQTGEKRNKKRKTRSLIKLSKIQTKHEEVT